MDTQLEEIISRISGAIHPEKIILFGSRARGGARPDSDYDLLIVYDGPLSKREVKIAVRRLFSLPDFSMDLFVISSDEFERQKKVVSTVGRVAFVEGLVCYG